MTNLLETHVKLVGDALRIRDLIGDFSFKNCDEESTVENILGMIALLKAKLTTEDFDKYLKEMSWRPYDHTKILDECAVSLEVLLEIFKERNANEGNE